MHHIVDIILGLIWEVWYVGIFLMMVIESSFIPFPSEVAMLPAGYLSALWEMNIYIAFLVGTLGAMCWATINYYLWMQFGSKVVKSMIHKYGKYILIREKHYSQAEDYFKSHGPITMLVGRFIPAVRQLISIPAGIFRMNYLTFLAFTIIGAGTWNAILLGIWYIAWKNDALVKQLLWEAILVIIVVLWTIVLSYIFYVKKQAKKLQKIEKKIEKNISK